MIRLLVLTLCLFSFTARAQEQISDDALLEESSAPAKTSPSIKPDTAPAPKQNKVRKAPKTTPVHAHKNKLPSYFWYGSLGYDLGGDIKFSKVKVESTIVPGFSTSSAFKTDGAIEAAGGFFSMHRNSWGYGADIAYQLGRKIKTITIDGVKFGGGGSVSTILLQGNGIYRMSHLFIPFGLNFGIPSYSKSSSDVGTTKVKGDIGAQVGVGYIPGNTGLFYEGSITMIGLQAQTEAGTETYTYKTAYLMAIGAKVGYLF